MLLTELLHLDLNRVDLCEEIFPGAMGSKPSLFGGEFQSFVLEIPLEDDYQGHKQVLNKIDRLVGYHQFRHCV